MRALITACTRRLRPLETGPLGPALHLAGRPASAIAQATSVTDQMIAYARSNYKVTMGLWLMGWSGKDGHVTASRCSGGVGRAGTLATPLGWGSPHPRMPARSRPWHTHDPVHQPAHAAPVLHCAQDSPQQLDDVLQSGLSMTPEDSVDAARSGPRAIKGGGVR